jgi:hypothetical protein
VLVWKIATVIVLNEPTLFGVFNPSEMPLRPFVRHHIGTIPRRTGIRELALPAQI